MKKLLIILPFIINTVLAQVDSLTHVSDSLSTVVNHKLDSIEGSFNNVASLQWVKDSLTINAWANGMRTSVQSKFSPDSLHLKNKIDSLSSLQFSAEPFSSKLDSLIHGKQNKFREIGEKQQELTSKVKTKFAQWHQKVKSRLDSLGFKGNIPSAAIPGLKQPNLPSVTLPDLPSLSLPELPSLSANDFSSLDFSPDLAKLNQELPFTSPEGLKGIQNNLSSVTEKISIASELKNNTGQTIENAVGEIDAVKEIKDQTKALESIQPPANPADQLADVNADQLKEQSLEKAVDHFAGKEEQLGQAMEKVSKYKQKYSDVQSLKDLPKKAPNPMKGKPFIERIVPGFAFQILKRDNFLLDIAPYIGYRFSGKLTIGAGWNQRASFNSERPAEQVKVYGPRIYGEYKVFKGISGRLELETMNAFVPQELIATDIGHREWVPAILAGMKQEYGIYKNLKGTALILYNFYNPDYKSPYGDRMNVRFGFEYAFRKKKKV